MPTTFIFALVHCGLVERSGQGLHDVWGMTNITAIATLSLTVAALTAASIRVFTRAGVT